MSDAVSADRPLVTFALFAYNQEQYIREAIEGAFAQTYEPLEIILSDDCSGDRTFAIMQEMAAEYRGPHCVRLRRNPQNVGLAQHINELVAASSSDYICWAAGDDISLPHRTLALVTPMILDRSVFGVHSGAIHMSMDSEKQEVASIPLAKQQISLNSVCQRGESVISQSHAFRKALFAKFGPLDPSLTNEGPVMAFRELVLGRVEYVDEPLIYYRRGQGVSTQRPTDGHAKQIGEPTKVARWRATAFAQILSDSKKCSDILTGQQIKMIKNNKRYYKNLLDINCRRNLVSATLMNSLIKPRSRESVTALIRVLLPHRLYALAWRIAK